MSLNIERISRLVRELLVEIGEDPNREGLLDTPARVAKSFEFLTSGYRTDTTELINGCRRAFKFDQLCALNFDQGLLPARHGLACG